MMNYRITIMISGTLLCLYSIAIFSNQLINSPLNTINGELATKVFEQDYVSFDDEDSYDTMNEFFDTVGIDHISRAIDPSDIMTLLNLFGIPKILELPFFLRTNILNKRSLLDQPLFEPKQAQYPGSWITGFSLFARKINRSNFTKDSDRLDSYLSLSEELFIQRLEDVIENINTAIPIPMINIAKIFSLFENMTVEERQIGFMLHASKRWRATTLRIMAPLYWLESNFSLTEDEQDAVAQELGRMEPEEEKAFRKAHFISDKIGLGDTRIEVDHRILKRPAFTLRCGGLATVPTAWIWGKGFLGSSFAKPSTLPTFELTQLFNVIENPTDQLQEEAIAFITDLFLDSLDRMAADLIDVPLGNRKHLGLGVYMRGKTSLRFLLNNSFAQRTSLTNRISLEWFLPATERRFYINKIDEVAFSEHNFSNTDSVVAAENLEFLKEQMVSRLFLRAIDTCVIPGVIFRWSSQAQYKGEIFGFNVGTDFWLQNKSRFSSIQTRAQVINEIDIPKAKTPLAYQSKVFGGIVLKKSRERAVWFFSLNADANVSSKGLCQDYSLSLNFEASF